MLVLRALTWSVDSDLNAPPTRWSAEFIESGSTGPFSLGEGTSQSGDDRVAIDVTIEGSTGTLLEGKVREWGFREGPKGLVSTAQGLDLKAELLDFHVATAQTYRGMQILSGSGVPTPDARKVVSLGVNSAGEAIMAAFYESFQTAAAKAVALLGSGFVAAFDCYDYDLGEDVVWETDRSLNDILVNLAAPFNATERYKLDITVGIDNVVRFVERGRSTPVQVEVLYGNLRDRQVQRSSYPTFNDVQVRGTTYQFVEPDRSLGAGYFFEGEPRGVPYTTQWRTVDRERIDLLSGIQDPTLPELLVAETVGTRYFDKFGRKYREAVDKTYFLYNARHPDTTAWLGSFPRTRTEFTDEGISFGGPGGQESRIVKTTFVQDFSTYPFWDGTTLKNFIANVAQYTERTESEKFFDADGNLLYTIAKTYRAPEPEPNAAGNAAPTGLTLEREVEERFWWSQGTYWRHIITRNFSRDVPGTPVAVSTFTEPAIQDERAMFRFGFEVAQDGQIGTWETGPTTYSPFLWPLRGAMRVGHGQVSAGPNNAQLRFAFGALGTDDDCQYFRGKILSERRADRYAATLEALPSLNFIEGRNLLVTGAPVRWERSTFFLHARSAGRQPESLTMTLRGVSWIDP